MNLRLSMSNNHTLLCWAVLVLCSAAAGFSCQKPAVTSDYPLSGMLLDINKNKMPDAELRGRVVLLDFWTSWCGPCLTANPYLENLHETYKNRGLKVLAVNYGENKELVESYLSNHPLPYPTAFADARLYRKIGELRSLPAFIIVDQNGIIRNRFQGFSQRIMLQIEEQIQNLLPPP